MSRPFDLMAAPLDSGTVVLEASAGTGKTYTLVGLLLRLLLEGKIERLDQALVVTFTVAATEELKNRVRGALLRTLRGVTAGDDDPFYAAMAAQPDAARRLRQALDDFDQVSIATIHGFCKRLLDEGSFETREPFALDFIADQTPYLHTAAADALRSCHTPGPAVAGALIQLLGFTPKDLVRHYSLWQRYPSVALQPDPPDPEAHYTAVTAAATAAADALDDEVCELIERFDYLANKSFAPVASRYSTQRLRERAGREPLLALPDLHALAPTRLAKTLKKNNPPLRHPFFAAADALHAAITVAGEHLRAALLRRMHERLAADKRDDHVLDFQDLLVRTHGALADPDRRPALLASINARYRTALIDEFQDTDRLQYEIFATCFADRPLFLIGDPKQSIYGFRGADLRAYLAAKRDAVASFTLGTNYRSNRALVEAVQRACGLAGAFVEPGIDLPTVTAHAGPERLRIAGDDGPPLQWRYVGSEGHDVHHGVLHKGETEERIAADVTAEITRLLSCGARCDDRPLLPRDIAVLCRTNAQATLMQDHLRRAGVVSAIGKAGDVFETDEVVELIRLMTAILQPRNLQLCRAAMATRLYGLDASALAGLEHDEAGFDEHLAHFERWRRTWMHRGFYAMQQQLLGDVEVERRLLPLASGERRLTNLQQLCELLHRAEHDNRLSPEGLLDWLAHERLHREEIDYQLRELRLESDGDAVQILTVHGSKGLEYEVVFCPFLWDAREIRGDAVVPTADRHELVFELWGSHPHKPSAERDRLAEDVRLTYVALTRARRRCYVHIGPIANAAFSALSWLLEPVPPDQQQDGPNQRPSQWLIDWHERMRRRRGGPRDLVAALVAASDGTMSLTEVPDDPRPTPTRRDALPSRGTARQARREPWARGLFSFSSLVADTGPEPLLRDTADPAEPVEPTRAPTGIFAFARGPAAGNCLHAMLEQLDWHDLGDGLTNRVRRLLGDHGLLTRDAHAADIDPVATVTDNLRELAAARIHDGGPTIGALCGRGGASEWQFTLPTVGSPMAGLVECFAASDSAIARAYAPRLAELPRRLLRGFLTGFVDQVAAHDERYWILDWKSNHLGNAPANYGPEALAAAMREHDYVLQYHLYVLALHRQLALRVPDYDYERHFGGVCYPFLRGARRDTAAGMFFDRPPAALVTALDDWAAGHPATTAAGELP